MKHMQCSGDLVDLGAITAETRGEELVGPDDVETQRHYLFGGGVQADD